MKRKRGKYIMNVSLISGSFVIREAVENIFKSLVENVSVVCKDNIKLLNKKEIIEADLIFIDIEDEEIYELDLISNIKTSYNDKKIMILDRGKNESIFKESIKYGVEGYIVNVNDKDDFIHNVKQIIKGKKVYEADLIQNILKADEIREIQVLTKREQDVLEEICKGLDNKTIASNLYITEHTVKRHIRSIFEKLKFKNRQEAIIYMNRKRKI
jgi:DNA-binding NarL/FixJ family response regulator